MACMPKCGVEDDKINVNSLSFQMRWSFNTMNLDFI